MLERNEIKMGKDTLEREKHERKSKVMLSPTAKFHSILYCVSQTTVNVFGPIFCLEEMPESYLYWQNSSHSHSKVCLFPFYMGFDKF